MVEEGKAKKGGAGLGVQLQGKQVLTRPTHERGRKRFRWRREVRFSASLAKFRDERVSRFLFSLFLWIFSQRNFCVAIHESNIKWIKSSSLFGLLSPPIKIALKKHSKYADNLTFSQAVSIQRKLLSFAQFSLVLYWSNPLELFDFDSNYTVDNIWMTKN